MRNKYKIVSSLLLTLLISASMLAQERTYSPYSRYGLGDIQEGGFGRNTGMGGTGIALSSRYHLNDLNPASYSGMDSLSFYFEAGINGFNQTFVTNESEASFTDSNFAYFALGFPIAKWGFFSMGLKPASMVGYNVFTDNSASHEITDANYTKSTYSGKGNTSKAYGGLSITPIKNLSIGAHASYLFGNIENYASTEFSADQDAFKFGSEKIIRINDFLFDFGAQYKYNLSDSRNIVIGGVYTPKTAVRGKYEYKTGPGVSLANLKEINTISSVEEVENDYTDNAFEMPLSYGAGISFNIENKLSLALDYKTDLWSNAKFQTGQETLADMQKVAFGVEYIPNDRSAKSYFSRIRYRAGAHYKNDYIVLDDHQLNDFGISFGLGMPLKRSRTSFNVAVEYGERGTTNYNLMKEKYTRFILNITFHEYWFMQRKFD